MKNFLAWSMVFVLMVVCMCVVGQIGQWRAEDAARTNKHWEGNIVNVSYSGAYSDTTILVVTGEFEPDARASTVFTVHCDGNLRKALEPGDRVTGGFDRNCNRILKGVVGGIPSSRWGGKKP